MSPHILTTSIQLRIFKNKSTLWLLSQDALINEVSLKVETFMEEIHWKQIFEFYKVSLRKKNIYEVF